MSDMGMDVGNESLESALGAAFGEEPPKAPAKAPAKAVREPQPDEVEEPVEPASDPADLLEGAEPEEAPAKVEVADPEFELEIEPGKPEVLPLSKLKELAARGAKAGRGFEENARVREALQAHVQQVQMQQHFNQAVAADYAKIQALEAQLKPFDEMNWVQAYDADPFNALKLKAQRDQLMEQRAAAIQEVQGKQQHFQAQFQQNAQRAMAAEWEALLSKVPTWRNAEKAAQEKGEISSALTGHYGFTSQEVSALMDHRMLLVARDAAAYRKLLANKDARVKQAREAQPTAKPGAAAQPNGRAEFAKARNLLKAHGAKGNHKAQESIAAAMFERAFK
jgi:hypothetical protein